MQARQNSMGPPAMPNMQPRQPETEENKYGPDGPVCGLGIVLVPTPFGSLCVASITDGGPAARSGRIYRGDFVETIDGFSVKDMTIQAVRPLILGRAGTSVTLGLRRESEDSVVYVRVMREPVRLGEVLVPGMRVNPVRLSHNAIIFLALIRTMFDHAVGFHGRRRFTIL